ncbi:hypothetical protein RHMOL_Rhmol12G0065300 [Rhododendron molle]|uniref:Uncharacterized protein n=1 Tax=Rhododendron molle TaxID=49168 RepID=A0ACC0LF94_RHOML|nr:hypothetical protein RHMOL_Rhmol12G0065300 [Rhododendron molle]
MRSSLVVRGVGEMKSSLNRGFKDGSQRWWSPASMVVLAVAGVDRDGGEAVEDPKYPNGVRLLIKDYPYVVDGLEIWSAIKKWVEDYCSSYYSSDDMVEKDSELRLWWNEIREKGHGDKKNASWWHEMQNLKELVETNTTIIWIASALHAAVNFNTLTEGTFLTDPP